MPGDLGSRGLILLETVITVIHCCHKGINIVRSNIDVYAKFWLYPLNVAPEIHSSDQATVFFQSSDHFGVRTIASVLLLADLSYTQRAICFKVRRVFRNALAHILVVTSRYLNNQAILWHHICCALDIFFFRSFLVHGTDVCAEKSRKAAVSKLLRATSEYWYCSSP